MLPGSPNPLLRVELYGVISDSRKRKESCVAKPVDKSEETKKPAEKPISLRPLEFEEAVEGLLRVGRKGNKITPTKAKSGTGDVR